VRENGTAHGLRSACKLCEAKSYAARQAMARVQAQHRVGGTQDGKQ